MARSSKHPEQIGKYKIESMLGRGAMGVVYAARHVENGAEVAIKTMLPKRLSGTVEAAVERFAHEVIAMNSLQHPGIVRVLDWDRDHTEEIGDVLFFAMELLHGETFETAVKRGPFFAPEACGIVLKIAEALHSAHSQGIVHRDIKPANVFLTNDGRVVITDFGVCKLSNVRPVTTVGSFIGTAPFLAPEVVQQQEADHRADIFSLGALFYNLLTRGFLRPISSIGELLFSITQGEEIARVRQLKGFDPRIVEILAHCVEKDPGRRFQQVADVVHALRPLAGGIPQTGQARAPAPVPDTPYAAEDAVAYQAPSTSVLPAPKKKQSQQPDWLLDSSADPHGSRFGNLAPGETPQQAQERQLLFDASQLQSFTFDGGDAFAALPSDPLISIAKQAPAAQQRVYLSQDAVMEIGQGGGPDTAAFGYFGLTPDMVAYLDHREAIRSGALADDGSQLSPEAQAAMAQKADNIDLDMLGLDLKLEQKTRRRLPWKLISSLVALGLFAAFLFFGLRARTVPLEVTSDPPGAQVTVDGEVVGVTPLSIKLRRAQRPKIAIEAPDREVYFKELVFPLLGEIKPLDVELPLASATLQLRSTPAGALVTLDSGAACRTPCALSSLPSRTKHLVAVNHEGCAPATFVFEAEPAETLERESHLTQLQLGSLSLIRVLADEQPIILDGEKVSALAARGAFFVYGGEHLLQLGRGEARREQILKLPPGQIAWLDLRATPEPPAKPASITEDEYKRRDASSPVSAQLDYAAYLAGQGQGGQAGAYLTKALKRDPGDPHALRLGIALALARTDAARAKIHASVFTALPKLPDDAFRVQRALDAMRGTTSCGVAEQ